MRKISTNADIAETAVIHDNVEIEDDVIIHDYVVIYPNTKIKKGVEIYDHCVLGKLPTSPGITSRKIKKELETLIVGENSILCPGVVLYAGSRIGADNLLGDFCSIREECETGDRCLISRNVSINYHTVIGHDTKIMDNTHITGNMIIGNHVFISILVATTNDNTMGREQYREDMVKGATIEDYVTVGAGANILPGIHIGENAVIGASALITKDVPANKVMMGIPAKAVRDVETRGKEKGANDTIS
jgi:acetyltransferase-like isoleucine patch superfamily enzyme